MASTSSMNRKPKVKNILEKSYKKISGNPNLIRIVFRTIPPLYNGWHRKGFRNSYWRYVSVCFLDLYGANVVKSLWVNGFQRDN